MTYPGDLSSSKDLFVLDFVAEPELLIERGKAAGITQAHTLEVAAWCSELNEQLKVLAVEAGVELQLMGGNAASLRLDASAQRGSRDNDYLTTATEQQIDALVARLAEKFVSLPKPLMRPKRISDEGKMKLPLVSYTVRVPSLTVTNEETLFAKIEFHLEDELPPGEQVTGRPFALGRDVTDALPALPYQVGLKLIVFDDPPVGIPPAREDAIPRQMHDIDLVAAKMTEPAHWELLGPYVRRRYEKERRFQGLDLEDDAPWLGIVGRMDDWATCDTDDAKWTMITNFQTNQVGKPSRRSVGDWRARARRIQAMAALVSRDRSDLYLRALALQERVNPEITGRESRAPRAALGEVMGEHWKAHKSKLNGYGLRTTFWEAVAVCDDHEARLQELADVLNSVSS